MRVEAASDDDGWAPLAGVGNIITNQRPDFDPRSYGYGKLSDLITATRCSRPTGAARATGSSRSSMPGSSAAAPSARRTTAKAVAPPKSLRRTGSAGAQAEQEAVVGRPPASWSGR